MKFSIKPTPHKTSRKKTWLILAILIFILLLVAAAFVVRKTYQDNLEPLSKTSKAHVITIEPGSSIGEIADLLKTKGVIKSDWAFEWYVRNKQLIEELKAGTFVVDQKQSVQEIVQVIVDGKVATDLITILPGKTLEQIKEDFIEEGFTEQEVEAAFKPEQYKDHPALTDKPEDATLEGYLYPETFQMTAETSAKEIVTLSLDELQSRLTSEVRQAISKQGLTLHQAMTLASIIENEVTTDEDRAKVAQVFLKRLNEDMRLESNATDAYAKKDPTYDTYKIDGLPPGPISNFTESAVNSIAYPAKTDWLFFVSGDDKKTYFSKTLEEHEKLIQQHCTTACGR